MCLKICSTSPSGGNQVDGLPPASSFYLNFKLDSNLDSDSNFNSDSNLSSEFNSDLDLSSEIDLEIDLN